MSDWSNLEDIMKDLSLAQGNAVPSTLETVAADQPPPILMPEEGSVERSYYESECVGEEPPRGSPDCKQIKMMLDWVKKCEEDKEKEEEDLVTSSALNPLSPEFVPRQKGKIKTNVALQSIKAAKEAELAARRPIPADVIPKMFKRKSLSRTEVSKDNVLPSQSSQTLSPDRTKYYTPSANASVYYSKYLKKSMLKEQIAEDVWVKAEKQMKEIETRQKLKAERTPDEHGNTSPPEIACVTADVMLPVHRHLLSDECIVCIVAAKHGYYF